MTLGWIMPGDWKTPVIVIFLVIAFSFVLMSLGQHGGVTGMQIKEVDAETLDSLLHDNAIQEYDPLNSRLKIAGQDYKIPKSAYTRVLQDGRLKVIVNNKEYNKPVGKVLSYSASGSTQSQAAATTYYQLENGKTLELRTEDSALLENSGIYSISASDGGYTMFKDKKVYKKVTADGIQTDFDKEGEYQTMYNLNNDLIYQREVSGSTETIYENKKGIETRTVTTTQGDEVVSKSVYQREALENGIVYWRMTDSTDPEAMEKYNQDARNNAGDRLTDYNAVVAELKEYGIANPVISEGTGTSTVTYNLGDTKISVTGSVAGNGAPNRVSTITKNGNEYVINEGEYFWDSTTLTLNDGSKKTYSISDKCGAEGAYCLKRGNDEMIPLTEQEYRALNDIDDLDEKAQKLTLAQTGQSMPDVEKRWNDYGQRLEAVMSSEISELFSAALDELLGEFSQQVPLTICNIFTGTDYGLVGHDDGDYEHQVFGVSFPRTSYQVDKEWEIYNDVRTAVVYGSAEEISPELHRYEVTVKLIGDNATGVWELYFRNSCDGTESAWKETGRIFYGQVFQMLYAGSLEDDMIFECSKEDCLFDQACLKFDDEPAPRCFRLSGGTC